MTTPETNPQTNPEQRGEKMMFSVPVIEQQRAVRHGVRQVLAHSAEEAEQLALTEPHDEATEWQDWSDGTSTLALGPGRAELTVTHIGPVQKCLALDGELPSIYVATLAHTPFGTLDLAVGQPNGATAPSVHVYLGNVAVNMHHPLIDAHVLRYDTLLFHLHRYLEDAHADDLSEVLQLRGGKEAQALARAINGSLTNG